MLTIRKELVPKNETNSNIAFQNGFDSCKSVPFNDSSPDLENCSYKELLSFYRNSCNVDSRGESYKEGVDFFVEELWKDLQSKRVVLTESLRLDELKKI